MVKKRTRPLGTEGRAEGLDDLTNEEIDELLRGHSMEGILSWHPDQGEPPGPYVTSGKSVFPSEEQRRHEWKRHRHLLMAKMRPKKPWAEQYYSKRKKSSRKRRKS